jgi:TDG/mug DNA glycosylase family protein
MTLPRSGVLPDDFTVPDVLAPDLRLVFCGTALGRQSALARAYYANPTNLFWRTLHEVGLTPERVAPSEYRRLLDYGIGLTDLAKGHFGNDAELPGDAIDALALREKILRWQPAILAFTSKTGASRFLDQPTGKIELGEQTETVGRTRLYVLPSPSGSGRRYWSLGPWQSLSAAVRALASERSPSDQA